MLFWLDMMKSCHIEKLGGEILSIL